MSRDLKFRAWNKKRKRMYEVLHLHIATILNGGIWADVKGYDCIDDKDIVIQIQPKDIEVMRFTGLHDKNGTEIYEGDIVQFTVNYSFGSNGIERNLNKGAVYYNEDMTLSVDGWMLSRIKSKEVIGNIYENPELLEESE